MNTNQIRLPRNDITYSDIGKSDTHAIENHFEELMRTMDDPDMFLPPDDKLLEKCLESNLSFAALHKGKIIGCRLAYVPGAQTDNLGYYFGLSDSEAEQVAQYQSISILKNYRGMGLGKAMQYESLARVMSQGFRYVTATCHPNNKVSLYLLVKLGFRYEATIRRIRGKERYVLLREIEPGIFTNPPQ